MKKMPDYQLYLVTDRQVLQSVHPEQSLESAVEQAILGGVTLIQLREKNLDSKAFFEQALAIKQVCEAQGVPLLINDRIDIALAMNADGVHIGQEDLPVAIVRRLIGVDKILGVTAKTVQQAQLAEQQGADYLGVGAVFGTTTKPDTTVLTIAMLKDICQAVTIPVIAIGGIGINNATNLQGTGIAGIAVVSGILAQPNIWQSSVSLKAMISSQIS